MKKKEKKIVNSLKIHFLFKIYLETKKNEQEHLFNQLEIYRHHVLIWLAFLLLILMNSVDVCVHLSAYSPRTGAKWVIVWRKPDMFIDHVVFKKKRKKEAYQSNVHIQIE